MKTLGVLLALALLIIPLTADALKCPDGAYIGVDNQGNEACRDIDTNQIIDPTTGLMFDSQTGLLILSDEQIAYIVIAIISIIVIFAGIAKLSQKKSEPEIVKRHGWSEMEKEEVRIRQDGKCNMCQKPPPRWEYDHIDNNRDNNDLSNCQGLCPNCHSVKTNE